jgi:hypothetical protein
MARLFSEGFEEYPAETPTYVRETQASSVDAPVIIGVDYGKLEQTVMALVMGMGVSVIHITADTPLQGLKADLIILDEFFSKMPEEGISDGEPVKQNGRSAAYLSFDKTKRHKMMKPTKRRRG